MDEALTLSGSLQIRPTRRLHIESPSDYVILPSPVSVGLANSFATFALRPTGADWCYEITEKVKGGTIRYVAVPDTNVTLDYADLIDVDPATFEPTAEPEAAWWIEAARLQAEIDAGGGSGGGGAVASVNGKVGSVTLTFSDVQAAPTVHSHTTAQVTGLDAALADKATNSQLAAGLAAKQDAGSYATTAALTSGLAGKAATSHTHTTAQVTGLDAALAGKQAAGSYAPLSHTHIIGEVSGLQTALDAKAAAQYALRGQIVTTEASADPGLPENSLVVVVP